jgi:hypothetical protein
MLLVMVLVKVFLVKVLPVKVLPVKALVLRVGMVYFDIAQHSNMHTVNNLEHQHMVL